MGFLVAETGRETRSATEAGIRETAKLRKFMVKPELALFGKNDLLKLKNFLSSDGLGEIKELFTCLDKTFVEFK